jgi:CRP-like cAMP-binding protein
VNMLQRLETKNGLLGRLPEDAANLVLPHLEPVTLAQNQVLFEPFQSLDCVYFFEGGLSSEIAVNGAANRIEVGCIGREGMSGVPAILGVDRTPHKSFMQVGGPALRLAFPVLQEAMGSGPLRALLLRYAHVFMIQIAATALADGRYKINQRLARWLLMCHDRLGDELPLTHDFLALMLGVRRSSVTDALHIIEGERLIKAERMRILVLDRRGLKRMAGQSYGVPEAEYDRLILGS